MQERSSDSEESVLGQSVGQEYLWQHTLTGNTVANVD